MSPPADRHAVARFNRENNNSKKKKPNQKRGLVRAQVTRKVKRQNKEGPNGEKRWSDSLKLGDKRQLCSGSLTNRVRIYGHFGPFRARTKRLSAPPSALPGPDHVCARRSQS